MELSINGRKEPVLSQERLGELLAASAEMVRVELWPSSSDGPSICTLRNGTHAFVMYLRHVGDSGTHPHR
jgi:hypothetical protein